jgi:hypothetical protein
LAEQMEVRVPVTIERDELTVQLHVCRKRLLELGQQRRYVPASTTSRPEAAMRADETAVTVQLRFEAPGGASRNSARAREHRFR